MPEVRPQDDSPISASPSSRKASVGRPVLGELPHSPPLELHEHDLWTKISDGRKIASHTIVEERHTQEPANADPVLQPRRRRPGTPTTIAESLIDGDYESSNEEKPAPASEAQEHASESTDEGQSFVELVERLVSMPMSKEDYKFNAAFLCLYRKFAAPAQLLAALIELYEDADDGEEPRLIVLASRLRIVGMLAKWVAEYPGDFHYPVTRQYLLAFASHLAKDRIFVAAVCEMTAVLDTQALDDDAGWAASDSARGEAATKKTFPGLPYLTDIPQLPHEPREVEEGLGITGQDVESFVDSVEGDNLSHARTSSSGLIGERSESQSTTSFVTLLDSVEAAQRYAELLGPLSRLPLSKIQWHQLMEYTDDDLAREMTRIDWIMYSAIRPRDLIRHVSLNEAKKENCRSLDHVNRMINHFNHVAFWTASMILLRDKPKHRAKALEKLMGVAGVSLLESK